MRTTVVGLGAVGGLIAARLAASGSEVQAIARGETLTRVRAGGLRLTAPDGADRSVRITVAAQPQELAPADLVIIALKGQAWAEVAPMLAPLWAGGATVLPAMNGVPWWYLQVPPVADPRPLESVDPGGRISAAVPLRQVLGCVVHLAASQAGPGEIRHAKGQRLIIGEPAGGDSERVHEVAALLGRAGFDVECAGDVRREVWYKLWGNTTMNPVSALTGADTLGILDDPLVAAFMVQAMGECAAIGAQIGCPVAETAEARMALTRELGAFRTSMLQDAEAGRRLELDAIVGAVREIGERIGVRTPATDAIFGLTRLMGRVRGLYS
jgi:2-dehydropantoate 2-reductase